MVASYSSPTTLIQHSKVGIEKAHTYAAPMFTKELWLEIKTGAAANPEVGIEQVVQGDSAE